MKPPESRAWPESWAPYMTWAKHHAKCRLDLTGSNLLPCSLSDLPGALDAFDLYGRNDDGWPPLVEAIAARYNVGAERVATASGASGANFMALASLLRPGDTLLAEWPGYDPQIGAARFLGAHVRTFQRGWEQRFALDPAEVEAALTDDTRVIVLTNLHNPSGAYADPAALAAVGDLARSVGAKVIVDEVYLDAVEGAERSPAATRDDVFVSTNSLTKSYGLAGLRIGWMLADAETTERALRVRDVVDGVGSIPSETLGVLIRATRCPPGEGETRARPGRGTRPRLHRITARTRLGRADWWCGRLPPPSRSGRFGAIRRLGGARLRRRGNTGTLLRRSGALPGRGGRRARRARAGAHGTGSRARPMEETLTDHTVKE